MPLYLSKFSYTPETWARLIDNPEDRRTSAEAYIASSDTYIHKDSSVNDEIDRLRHAATSALLTRRDVGYRTRP